MQKGGKVKVTQCAIVDAHIAGPPACAGGGDGACALAADPMSGVESCANPDKDRQGYLNEALEALGLLEKSVILSTGKDEPVHYVDDLENVGIQFPISDRLDFDEIKALLRNNRLVCLRIFNMAERHFIILYGFKDYPDNDVLIWDPARGHDVVDFDELEAVYGRFTHKLITRPLSGGA